MKDYAMVREKDPNPTKDFGLDWKDLDDPWLEDGEVLTSSQWEVVSPVEEGGLVVIDGELNETKTVVWLSGGIDGHDYEVRNRVTTSRTPNGDDRTILILVRER